MAVSVFSRWLLMLAPLSLLLACGGGDRTNSNSDATTTLTGLAQNAAPAALISDIRSTFICLFASDVPAADVPGLSNTVASDVGAAIRHRYVAAVKGFSAKMSAVAAQKIEQNNSNIVSCEQDALAQAGARGGRVDKPSTTQVIPENISMVGGFVDLSASNARAWIIDSGIAIDHPDLNVDAASGANFLTIGKNSVDDNNGHGTFIAGIIGAKDNNQGIVGVASGIRVVPVRVMHSSMYASISDMVAGIDYVAQKAKPGDVANMSIWAYEHSDALHNAAAGLADVIPFVVIAGNDAEDINSQPAEPSHVEHPNLYTVSSIDLNGDFDTIFSNFGNGNPAFGEVSNSCKPRQTWACATVDIAAPGIEVVSLKRNGALVTWQGTSFAAPHVTGVILANGGTGPTTLGTANGDPDAHADPVVHLY